jgi:hypothetical protein
MDHRDPDDAVPVRKSKEFDQPSGVEVTEANANMICLNGADNLCRVASLNLKGDRRNAPFHPTIPAADDANIVTISQIGEKLLAQ